MSDFYKGKRVAVIGAAGGIGSACAAAFAARGADLLLIDINADGLAKVAAGLSGAGSVATHVSDLTGPEKCAAALDAAGGPIYAMVHMAGVYQDDPLDPAQHDIYDRAIASNLTAAYDLVIAFHARRAQGEGFMPRIVLASSIAFRRGSIAAVAYSAAKAGIMGLVRGAVQALGPRFADQRHRAGDHRHRDDRAYLCRPRETGSFHGGNPHGPIRRGPRGRLGGRVPVRSGIELRDRAVHPDRRRIVQRLSPRKFTGRKQRQ